MTVKKSSTRIKPRRRVTSRSSSRRMVKINPQLARAVAEFATPFPIRSLGVGRCFSCGGGLRAKKKMGRKPDPDTAKFIELKRTKSYTSILRIYEAEERQKYIAELTTSGMPNEKVRESTDRRFDDAWRRSARKKVIDACQRHNKKIRQSKVSAKLAASCAEYAKLPVSNFRRRRVEPRAVV